MDQIVTYTHARQDLSDLMDAVLDNEEIVAITRDDGPPVVMLSLANFQGYEETAHLLSTEANRRALAESIAQWRAGDVRPYEPPPEEE
jgi:antitoxin YefM